MIYRDKVKRERERERERVIFEISVWGVRFETTDRVTFETNELLLRE